MGTVLFLIASAAYLAAPNCPPTFAPASGTNSSTVLYSMAIFLPVIVGESVVTLFMPSPNNWNPLWLPFGLESAVNLVAIWLLLPVMARRVVSPSST